MTDYSIARHNMVESQLKPNKITDERIIAVMSALPRENFLAKDLRGVAYVDEDVRVAPGRYLMEPVVFARMIQGVKIGPKETILEIGCGAGYSTAVLARLGSRVVAVEADPALAKQARENLAAVGVVNAEIVEAPLVEGYARRSPYQVIFVSGAVEKVPSGLIDQIAEGGRLIAVERGNESSQAVIYSRSGGLVGCRALFDANVPVLPGFGRPVGFVF